MKMIWRVDFVESERGWSQDYWSTYYETWYEAEKARIDTNSNNTSAFAPDWYLMASGPVEVDILSVPPLKLSKELRELQSSVEKESP